MEIHHSTQERDTLNSVSIRFRQNGDRLYRAKSLLPNGVRCYLQTLCAQTDSLDQQNPRTKISPPPIIYQFSLYPHLIHTLIFISSCSALDLALHSYGQRSQIRSHMLPTSIWGEGHVQNGCEQRLPSPLWMEFIKMKKSTTAFHLPGACSHPRCVPLLRLKLVRSIRNVVVCVWRWREWLDRSMSIANLPGHSNWSAMWL